MAIDGVKIIDSDDGHDIYNYVIETYKDGVSIDHIVETILKEQSRYCTDSLYAEIYWTSLAYALWKIGHLSEEIKHKALEYIRKGADEFWRKIDEKAPQKRQKVLDQLAVQLERENPKPIQIPKAKKKQSPYFSVGDVLAIQFGEQYGIAFVSALNESPRKIEYHLACTRTLQKGKPSMDDFLNSELACGKQNHSFCLSTDCWFNHKDLGLLLDHIEKIGKVRLEDYFLGTLCPASTLEDIYAQITRNRDTWQFELTEVFSLIRDFEACES